MALNLMKILLILENLSNIAQSCTMRPIFAGYIFLLARSFFSSWWWRRYYPPKRRLLQKPHGITSQKTVFFSPVSCSYTGRWVPYHIIFEFFCIMFLYGRISSASCLCTVGSVLHHVSIRSDQFCIMFPYGRISSVSCFLTFRWVLFYVFLQSSRGHHFRA
jgi:hypothetical protein